MRRPDWVSVPSPFPVYLGLEKPNSSFFFFDTLFIQKSITAVEQLAN